MLCVPTKQLLTHEHPDIDAMMSVLLMKTFGEEQFPGAANAPVIFVSAGNLPEQKTAEELEAEGIIALDTGGGRFDTHPANNEIDDSKLKRSATDLVAETLGVLQHPHWEMLIEYVRIQDSTGQGMRSTDYLHHIVSLPNILTGLQLLYPNNSEKQLEVGLELLKVIPKYLEHKVSKNAYDRMAESFLTQTPLDNEALNFLVVIQKYIDSYLKNKAIDVDNAAPQYKKLLDWRQRLLTKPKQAFSRNKLDDVVSLKAVIIGAHYYFEGDEAAILKHISFCLDAIIAREERWVSALQTLAEKAIVEEVRGAKVVGIESENGLVIKAARFRYNADLVVYRNTETGGTSFIINRKGRLHSFDMSNLAAKVRLVEAQIRAQQPDYEQARAFGNVHEWFYHQSGNFLICGSLKAPDFSPSKIPLIDLLQITYTEIDWSASFPMQYLDVYVNYKFYLT